jgi:hypothetical protein
VIGISVGSCISDVFFFAGEGDGATKYAVSDLGEHGIKSQDALLLGESAAEIVSDELEGEDRINIFSLSPMASFSKLCASNESFRIRG